MKQIRNQLLATIQTAIDGSMFLSLDKVKDMKNSKKAIDDLERCVFANATILIGDMDLESERFSHAYLKQTYTFKLIFAYKTKTASDNVADDLDTLHDLFTNQNYNLSDVANSYINNITPEEQFNSNIYYREIELKIFGYENVSTDNIDNYTLQPFYFYDNSLGYLTVIEQ